MLESLVFEAILGAGGRGGKFTAHRLTRNNPTSFLYIRKLDAMEIKSLCQRKGKHLVCNNQQVEI